MKAVLGSEDSPAPGQASKLKCSLIGFGAGVTEEHSGAIVSHALNQLRSRIQHWLSGEEVRGMRQSARLVGYRLCYVLIAVSQGINRNAC